ncbi:MAG: hypothetical protein ACREOF_10810 [Gemmatimonadales bacterium]
MDRDDAGRIAREILTDLSAQPRATAGEPLAHRLLLRLVADARELGVAFERYAVGPWHVGQAALRGVDRLLAHAQPTVERGGFAFAVRDAREALELVGFLNWCEVPEPSPG